MTVTSDRKTGIAAQLRHIDKWYGEHRVLQDVSLTVGSGEIVALVGRSGYGNFVGIQGPGGVGTGYGHLSRVLVRSGEHVSRGQLVGYSGNSGLSTGPHLHFEVYRGGATVNPRGFSFSSMAALSGSALRAFKAKVAELLAVRPGTAR